MIDKNLKIKILAIYFVVGIVILLPIIFLFASNLGVDLNRFVEYGKLFEKVNDFQVEGFKNSLLHQPYRVFDLFTIFYVFHRIFGEPVAFNVMLILLFFAGSCAGYCLLQYFVRANAMRRERSVNNSQLCSNNKTNSYTSSDPALLQKERRSREVIIASFISGIFFGLLALYFPITPFLGFFILFLFKFLEKLELKFGVLAALLFLFLVNYSLFIGISAILLTIIIFIFWAFSILKISKANFAQHKRFLIKFAILFIILLLFFGVKYYFLLRTVDPIPLDSKLFLQNSFDAVNFVSLFSNWVFVTIFIVASLCLVYIFYLWNKHSKNKWLSLSIILSFLFFIFSLGPYWQVADEGLKIPLPYLLLYYYFPYFNQTADLGGFLMFGFVFSILGICLGMYYLAQNVILRRSEATTKDPTEKQEDSSISLRLGLRMTAFFGVILLIFIFSFWAFWRPQTSLTKLNSNEYGTKAIFIAPDTSNLGRIFYVNSANRGQVIAGSSLFFDNFEKRKYGEFVAGIVQNLPDGKAINYANFFDYDYQKTLNSYLQQERVEYIIFDNQFLDLNKNTENLKNSNSRDGEILKFQNLLNFRKTIKFFSENSTGRWKISGDNLVYELVPNSNIPKITAYFGDNWGKADINPIRLEVDKIKEFLNERWMLQNSTLILENNSPAIKNLQLMFKASARDSFKKMDVYYENKKVDNFIVGPDAKNYLVNLENVAPGKSEIKFKVFDFSSSGEPLEVKEENKQEPVLFKEVRFNEVDKIETPNFFDEIAKNDKDAKILVLPAEVDYLKNKQNVLKYDDIMDKTEEKYINAPLLDKLFFDNLDLKSTLDIFNRDYYNAIGQETINKYNIRYIALYKNWLDEREFSDLAKFILSNFDIESVSYNDDRTVVLQIKQKDWQKQIPLEFEGNWSFNVWDKRLERFFYIAFDEARMTLFNPENKDIGANLKFKIENFQGEKRKIKVYLNEDWLDEKTLKEFDVLPMKLGKEKYIDIELPNLRPQENDIMFKIFKEDGKEAVIYEDKGIRMSDFQVERADEPIKQEFAKEVDYCNDKFKPIFEKYNFKKEFYDGFEDENYTRNNLDLNWRVKFTQREKYHGKQALTTLNEGTDIKFTKPLYGCFNKITMNIAVKAKRWNPGADLYFMFIKRNNNNILELPVELKQDIKHQIVLFTPVSGIYYKNFNKSFNFSPNIKLNKWNDLKIIWERGEQFEFYNNMSKIFTRKDRDDGMPTELLIMVSGGNPEENIDVYFDDFKLILE